MRAKWTAERRVGKFAQKRMRLPVSESWWPSCSMRRSSSRLGRSRVILRPDFHRAADLPLGVGGGFGSRARDVDFHVLKLIGNLGTSAGQLIPKADGEVGPGLSVRRICIHAPQDESARRIDVKARLSSRKKILADWVKTRRSFGPTIASRAQRPGMALKPVMATRGAPLLKGVFPTSVRP